MAARDPESDSNYLNEVADFLELDDDDRESFIGDSMKKLGYAAKTIVEWLVPEPEGNDNGPAPTYFNKSRQASPKQRSREISGARSNPSDAYRNVSGR